MANERKTEIITRKHFEQFQDIIEIEEQSSDNPKIDKLLKTASKKGTGKGRPEFLISYKKNSDQEFSNYYKAQNKVYEDYKKVQDR